MPALHPVIPTLSYRLCDTSHVPSVTATLQGSAKATGNRQQALLSFRDTLCHVSHQHTLKEELCSQKGWMETISFPWKGHNRPTHLSAKDTHQRHTIL